MRILAKQRYNNNNYNGQASDNGAPHVRMFCCFYCCCGYLFAYFYSHVSGVTYPTHCDVRAMFLNCIFTKFIPLLLFFVAMLSLSIRGNYCCSRCKFKRSQNYYAFDTFTFLMCRYTTPRTLELYTKTPPHSSSFLVWQ